MSPCTGTRGKSNGVQHLKQNNYIEFGHSTLEISLIEMSALHPVIQDIFIALARGLMSGRNVNPSLCVKLLTKYSHFECVGSKGTHEGR